MIATHGHRSDSQGGQLKAEALAGGAVGPAQLAVRSATALSDADHILTAAQLIGGLFTITPTAGRALTVDTAANILAALPGAQVGTSFEVTIVCLAAFAATLTADAGGTVTIVGGAAANDDSATFVFVLTDITAGAEAVTAYRK